MSLIAEQYTAVVHLLSDILKLPEPQLPKRKRRSGFNTGKAVAITDTSFVTELKGTLHREQG